MFKQLILISLITNRHNFKKQLPFAIYLCHIMYYFYHCQCEFTPVLVMHGPPGNGKCTLDTSAVKRVSFTVMTVPLMGQHVPVLEYQGREIAQ